MNRLSLGLGVISCACAASVVHGQVTFHTDPMDYSINAPEGKFLKGLEDFEESTAEIGSKTPFPNSLQHGVPAPTFEFGINATNLIIQTNITPGPSPAAPNPSNNQNALWVNGAGFIGSNSIKVGTDEFLSGLDSSLDLIFTTHDKTGVALDVSTFDGFNAGHGGWVFTVYDQFDNVMGTFGMPPTPTEPSKTFFGVWSAVPIGRLNVHAIFPEPLPFAIDNIQMWVPSPGATAMLGVGGLALLRRRR